MSSTAQDIADAAKAGDTARANHLIAACTNVLELAEARVLVAAITDQTGATRAILAAIDARVLALLKASNDAGETPLTAEELARLQDIYSEIDPRTQIIRDILQEISRAQDLLQDSNDGGGKRKPPTPGKRP